MTDELYMRRCLELAQRSKGYTAPNPMVGAVLVHKGRVLSEGWHHRYGGNHAEVDCLEKVAEADRHLIADSTMYVSLEPCAHQGKTPPCAHRLVQENIGKVVIANRDPFAQVNGRGIDILKNAGIEVTTGLLEREGLWVNRKFFTYHTLGRPYVILKWAQSVDGYMAPAEGGRYQISNSHSRQLLHRWRTEESAIMVGTRTALVDDPQLTARYWTGKQPLCVVLDRTLKIPGTHQLFDESAATLVINEMRDGTEKNIEYLKLAFDNTLIPEILKKLHERGILSVIVEGGAQLLDAFNQQALWDEARVFTGNMTLGDGLPSPLLSQANCALTVELDGDRLQLLINGARNKFSYVDGIEL